MLALVGEDSHDHATFSEGFCYSQSSAASGAGRNAYEKAFLRCQPARAHRCILISYRDDFVQDVPIQHRGDKACTDALDLVIAGFPSRNYR